MSPGDRYIDCAGEILPVSLTQLSGIIEARAEQRIAGPDRVVDLMRHHANNALVGGALRASQVFSEFLEQQKLTPKNPVHELGLVHLHAAVATQRNGG